jgi:hypothetical protein
MLKPCGKRNDLVHRPAEDLFSPTFFPFCMGSSLAAEARGGVCVRRHSAAAMVATDGSAPITRDDAADDAGRLDCIP